MASTYYEIRLAGTLPPEALIDFERLTARAEPAGTILNGRLPDQAALHGLLARLELLGAQILEVRRGREPAGEERPGADGIPGAAEL